MVKLVVSCEHAGNVIPKQYQAYFKNYRRDLNSHEGLDIGALALAKSIAKTTKAPLFVNQISRLLVEANRSLHHKHLFSKISENIPKVEREKILARYYFPYRNQVEQTIESWVKKRIQVVHISVHTFTPSLHGKDRNADIGLLFDSRRKDEKYWCQLLKTRIIANNEQLQVRYNYPYLGKADGFTSYLRKKFTEKNYIGIELEVNQKYFIKNSKSTKMIVKTILAALKDVF